MDTLIPATASIAMWINAKVKGNISDSDFANACESHLNMVIPIPKAPVQVNSTDCALDRHQILRQGVDGRWSVIERDNSLVALDPTAAKQALLDSLAAAVELLTSLPTVGTRAEIDDILDHMYSPHLPPLPGRIRESLELAIRIRLVCLKSLSASEIPSSPSSANAMTQQLREIDDLALGLICAIASNA